MLRRVDEIAELAPQPGVGQIHGLVERAREQHRQVELEVDGDPGPLPASVDLGVYRILDLRVDHGRGVPAVAQQ